MAFNSGNKPAIAQAVRGAVHGAEIEAEQALAMLRIFCALVLAAPHLLRPVVAAPDHPGGLHMPSTLAFATLFLIGVTALILTQHDRFRPWMRYAFAVADAVMVGVVSYLSLSTNELPGTMIFAVPVVWCVPLLMTVGALRYRPGIQVWSAGLFVAALAAAALAAPVPMPSLSSSGLEQLYLMPPSISRLVLLILTALASVVVIVRARRTLWRAQEEAHAAARLSRFLPQEIVPLLTEGDHHDGGDAQRGRRQMVTILFIDIRNSTQIAEGLDPQALSDLISGFRAIVQRATRDHGGMIDKFIGDGAMVLFGVPSPASSDAARALACARAMLRLVEARNRAVGATGLRFDVGIGLHCGTVYCGIIGDEQRREFTVIGDAVNAAARIEEATKRFAAPLLASQDVVSAAGEEAHWETVSVEPLRGKQSPIALMAPRQAMVLPLKSAS